MSIQSIIGIAFVVLVVIAVGINIATKDKKDDDK